MQDPIIMRTLAFLVFIILSWIPVRSTPCDDLFAKGTDRILANDYTSAEKKFREARDCFSLTGQVDDAIISYLYVLECIEKQYAYVDLLDEMHNYRKFLRAQQDEIPELAMGYYTSAAELFFGKFLLKIGAPGVARDIFRKEQGRVREWLSQTHSKDDSLRLVRAFALTAEAEFATGEYHAAIENAQAALFYMAPFTQLYREKDGLPASLYAMLGKCYTRLDNQEEAAKAFSRAEDELQFLREGRADRTFHFYRERLAAALQAGAMGDARTFLGKMKQLTRFEQFSLEFHLAAGMLAKQAGETELAISYFQQALQLAGKQFGNRSLEYARVMGSLSKAYAQKGMTVKAEALSKEAVAFILPRGRAEYAGAGIHGSTLASPEALEVINWHTSLLMDRYLASGAGEVLDTARWYAFTSVRLLESLQDVLHLESDKEFLASEGQITFERAIALAGAEPILPDTLFMLMEKSKAYILREARQAHLAREVSSIPDSLLVREQVLKQEIRHRERELRDLDKMAGGKGPSYPEMASGLAELRSKLLALEGVFSRSYPAYARVVEAPHLVSLKMFQGTLVPDEQVLEFFTGAESLYCLKITTDGTEWIVVPVDFDLEDVALNLMSSIQAYAGSYLASEVDRYAELASFLYESIVRPLGQLRSDLLIIPDGGLNLVVFEALLRNPPDSDDRIADFAFMARDFHLRYAWSASLGFQRQEVQGQGEILIVAPEFNRQDDGGKNLQLAHNRDEARMVIRQLDGMLLSGREAAKSSFLAQVSDPHNGWKMAHLATHGQANPTRSADAYLEFYAPKSADSARLFAYELYSMQLPLEFIYLSACETGFGELSAGEGLISLARAFAYAGVGSVITSLWKVSDMQAAESAKLFYDAFSEGIPAHIALSQARREYLDRLTPKEDYLAHPVYWSGLIAIGNRYGFTPERDYGFFLPLLICLVVGIITWRLLAHYRVEKKK